MPLTKQYLRYEHTCTFGVGCSKKSNAILLEDRSRKKSISYKVLAPALEDVYMWDVRTYQRLKCFKGEKSEVTALALSSDERTLAVGYDNGIICLWDVEQENRTITFNGHKSAVLCLDFDQNDTRLVSGSKDTNVILWDVVSESGLFRLKGHKGPVTHCVFATTANVVVSSSKDTFIKFWDLDTKHCFYTLVGHRSEIWSFVLLREDSRLITGSSDFELKVYSLNLNPEPEPVNLKTKRSSPSSEDTESVRMKCDLIGQIKKASHEHVVGMTTDSKEQCLLVHTTGMNLEVFILRTDKELEEISKKRERKAARKSRKTGQIVEPQPIGFQDEFVKIQPFKASSKIKALDVRPSPSGELKVLVCLASNTMELWTLERSANAVHHTSSAPFQLSAHPSDVRAVTFSSDDTCIASGSSNQIRVWNRSTQQCIRTFSSGYVLSMAFAPGNRHVVVGTKGGELELYDIGSGVLLESVLAHSGSIWSVEMTPDKRGFMTGSADHDVKFWDFDLKSISEGESSRKVLTASHVKTLKMTEDVLCLKCSNNQKFLAISLLDSTVKVLLWDTLKFYLSLYGHRLPVLCMDISSDNTLIVTGSSDKNIKIWGLDFGDCHRSLFAHDNSIMALQFVSKTHMVFTASKDRTVKCWDVDSFEHVMTLEGHQGEVWTLAVSHDGDTVVSGSHDNSLRLWERTEEPLILSEEREIEREMEFEEDVVKNSEPVVPGESNQEVAIAGRRTIESIKAAERILEAIELYREESTKMADHRARCAAAQKQLPGPTPNPILMAFGNVTPERYVLEVVKKVRSSELDESLLVMPFLHVVDLLSLLKHWLELGWEVELSCKCLFFLLKVHHKQIVANKMLVTSLDDLKKVVLHQVTRLKSTAGFNLAALQLCQRELKGRGIHTFEDISLKTKKNVKKRKITVISN